MSKGTIKYSQEFKSEFGNKWIGIDLVVNENDDWDEKFSEVESRVKKWGIGDDDFRRWSITENGITKVPTYPQPIQSIDRAAIEKTEIAIDNSTSIDELAKLKDEAGRLGLMAEYNMKRETFK